MRQQQLDFYIRKHKYYKTPIIKAYEVVTDSPVSPANFSCSSLPVCVSIKLESLANKDGIGAEEEGFSFIFSCNAGVSDSGSSCFVNVVTVVQEASWVFSPTLGTDNSAAGLGKPLIITFLNELLQYSFIMLTKSCIGSILPSIAISSGSIVIGDGALVSTDLSLAKNQAVTTKMLSIMRLLLARF